MTPISAAHVSKVLGEQCLRSRTVPSGMVKGLTVTGSGFKVTKPGKWFDIDLSGTQVYVTYVPGGHEVGELFVKVNLDRYVEILQGAGYTARIDIDTYPIRVIVTKEE